MTLQPTNEGGSEARMNHWIETANRVSLKDAWNYQEAYWSKRCHSPQVEGEKEFAMSMYEASQMEITRLKSRCEAMEKALKDIYELKCEEETTCDTNTMQGIAIDALDALKEKG